MAVSSQCTRWGHRPSRRGDALRVYFRVTRLIPTASRSWSTVCSHVCGSAGKQPRPRGFPRGHVVVNLILGGEQSADLSYLITSSTREQVSRGPATDSTWQGSVGDVEDHVPVTLFAGDPDPERAHFADADGQGGLAFERSCERHRCE
jgi:hypothetical protein